jgi:hypothetical protein
MSGEKKPPAWATIVGILGICFGALGLMGGGYELMMPMMMSMQKKMMEGMKDSIKQAPKASAPSAAKPSEPPVDPRVIFKTFEEFMSMPPWYERFSYINGTLQLLLAALYILASVFLLVVRRGAATFFVAVAAVSSLRNLAAVAIGLSSGSFMAFWSVAAGAAGFLIDLVLSIVVLVSDRSAYRSEVKP